MGFSVRFRRSVPGEMGDPVPARQVSIALAMTERSDAERSAAERSDDQLCLKSVRCYDLEV